MTLSWATIVGAGLAAWVLFISPSSSMPSWKTVGLSTAGVVTASLALLYKFQERLLYLPGAASPHIRPRDNPQNYRRPDEWGMPFEDVTLVTADSVRLAGWMIKQPSAHNAPTLVYFHANAGNMGFRLPSIDQMYHRLSCNVFIISYRGYGDSEGTPSEQGLMLDAEAVLEHLLRERQDIDPRRLVVFGRSLGGAVALFIAKRYNAEVRATIIENTFTSIPDMVDVVLPLLAPLKRLILRIDWPSRSRIGHVTHPILFLSGTQDELVPSHQMEALYAAAVSSPHKEIHRVEDGTHNDTWLKGGEAYVAKMLEFITRHASATRTG
ncbi:Serine aminopeptidase S33 domain-containing protein [Plasmodiophora brassicae]